VTVVVQNGRAPDTRHNTMGHLLKCVHECVMLMMLFVVEVAWVSCVMQLAVLSSASGVISPVAKILPTPYWLLNKATQLLIAVATPPKRVKLECCSQTISTQGQDGWQLAWYEIPQLTPGNNLHEVESPFVVSIVITITNCSIRTTNVLSVAHLHCYVPIGLLGSCKPC
jgi:hypothetical protein